MKKILVIEDEPITRNLFLDLLAAEGYHTIAAQNGLIGVQKAQEQLPDLVLCDIIMPLLDGYGVLKVLRQHPALAIVPFIFLSARVNKADIRKGMELGADDYLTKPCTLRELKGSIAAQLEKQAVQKQWYATNSHYATQSPFSQSKNFAGTKSIFPSIPQLREIFDFIEANYHKPITLSDVAEAVGYSRCYLTNLVASQTGQTVNRWIIERRMVEARSLLLQTNSSVKQIASAVGYQTMCNFFRQFRQIHGETPQAWRKNSQTQFTTKTHKNDE